MWVIKVLNSNNQYQEHHYDDMSKASDDYTLFTNGINNNDDGSIKVLAIDTVEFPKNPKYLN